MPSVLQNRAIIVWTILVAATLLSFETMVVGRDGAARCVILIVAFAKVTLVGREFMELRHAPKYLLWPFQIWVAVLGVALVVLFLA
ncbi:cytochrome C oxidase subunit IV family protein [Novosphingobium aerophilum]|uniref:cytochrome C oxidase subunit IV family protein n=1 Tax=Novosphingobium TaxID=165696 RepID=UPI0037576204